jgi:hypothetical protein
LGLAGPAGPALVASAAPPPMAINATARSPARHGTFGRGYSIGAATGTAKAIAVGALAAASAPGIIDGRITG